MRGVSGATFKDRMLETIVSILNDADAGKLHVHEKGSDTDVPAFVRLSQPIDGVTGIDTADLVSLVVERLEVQGYSLFFDEMAARTNMADALARAGTLIERRDKQAQQDSE
jgi:hypothetical protein